VTRARIAQEEIKGAGLVRRAVTAGRPSPSALRRFAPECYKSLVSPEGDSPNRRAGRQPVEGGGSRRRGSAPASLGRRRDR